MAVMLFLRMRTTNKLKEEEEEEEEEEEANREQHLPPNIFLEYKLSLIRPSPRVQLQKDTFKIILVINSFSSI